MGKSAFMKIQTYTSCIDHVHRLVGSSERTGLILLYSYQLWGFLQGLVQDW